MTINKRMAADLADASWATLVTVPAGSKAMLRELSVVNDAASIANVTWERVNAAGVTTFRDQCAVSIGTGADLDGDQLTLYAGDSLRVRVAAAPSVPVRVVGSCLMFDSLG